MPESRMVAFSTVLLWAGATLLLSELPRLARPKLADRLGPYVTGPMSTARNPSVLSVESFAELIGPLSKVLGERMAHVFGVTEDLGLKLQRIHSDLDVTGFRVRQIVWSGGAVGLSLIISALLHPPPLLAFLLVPAAALLAFLAIEQQVASASSAWQRRLFLELPVVSEQLAMLLSSGYSLSAAVGRIADRGKGTCARDLARVRIRMLQGASELEALREWSAIAQVEAVDRLVSILALNSEAADLGRLISEETRSLRRDVQRKLVETMERRSQQVWVPVTVAALVPGVIFLVVPFVSALRLFAGG